jgi:putative ABC transport system permease protein
MMRTRSNLVKPRWRKVFSDLWNNKVRTLLVIASIAVGVFAVGTIVTAYEILAEDIGDRYEARNPANIEIRLSPFYENLVRVIERVPGVLNAEGRQIIQVRASRDGVDWQKIKLISVEDIDQIEINLLAGIEGKSIPDRRELIISHDFLNSTGFQVGDTIQIEMPDGSKQSLPLVGLVSDQVTNGRDFLGGANAYISFDTMVWLGGGDSFNHLYVRVHGDSNDESHIDKVAAQLEEKLERNNYLILHTKTQSSNQHPMASIVLALLGVMAALGALILVLSSSLIVNTLNALLSQHLRQIGVMKLVGARSPQILGMYLVLILSYGFVALMLALPFSGGMGYALALFITGFINADIHDFRVIPAAIVLQVLIAVLVPLVAGFFPVNQGARTNVRRAITNDQKGNQPTGASLLTRISSWVGWLSRPILLSLRNTFRHKSRLVLTIFTLTTAGAIFIAVFNVRSSMRDFTEQIGQHFQADITLSFKQPYPISRIEQVVGSIPGVMSVEGWGAGNVDIVNADEDLVSTIQIMAPPADSTLVNPEIITGRWFQAGEHKALVVADSIYEEYPQLVPGDFLRVETPEGRTEAWMVVGIFRFTGNMDDILAYTDFGFISDFLDMPNQAQSFRVVTQDHQYENQVQISRAIDKTLRDHDFRINEIQVGTFTQDQTTKGINVLIIFLLLMALLTAFVGSIGLTGTMSMNVMERTREIGVMRAIGAIDREIVKTVIIEGSFIGLITWLLAVFLSFPISSLLLKIVSEAMLGSTLPLTFTFQGFLIWLAAVLSLSLIASLLPARNAASLTIREVLAYE